MKLYKDLTPEEEPEYRKWAREHYEPFSPILGLWHPTIQEECTKINRERDLELKELLP